MGWGSGVRVCRMIPSKLGPVVARGIKMSYSLPSGPQEHLSLLVILLSGIHQFWIANYAHAVSIQLNTRDGQ